MGCKGTEQQHLHRRGRENCVINLQPGLLTLGWVFWREKSAKCEKQNKDTGEVKYVKLYFTFALL